MIDNFMSDFKAMLGEKKSVVASKRCGDKMFYEINLAGYSKDDVAVKFNADKGVLAIKAARKVEECGAEVERSQENVIELDDKPMNVKFENGLLTFESDIHDEMSTRPGFNDIEIQ